MYLQLCNFNCFDSNSSGTNPQSLIQHFKVLVYQFQPLHCSSTHYRPLVSLLPTGAQSSSENCWSTCCYCCCKYLYSVPWLWEVLLFSCLPTTRSEVWGSICRKQISCVIIVWCQLTFFQSNLINSIQNKNNYILYIIKYW